MSLENSPNIYSFRYWPLLWLAALERPGLKVLQANQDSRAILESQASRVSLALKGLLALKALRDLRDLRASKELPGLLGLWEHPVRRFQRR